MYDLEDVYRRHGRQVLATLIRLLGGFELAEEALQIAFLAAAERWPKEGMPSNPRSWLISAGRFRTIDMLRRRARFRALEPEVARLIEERSDNQPDPDLVEDDMLRLVFTCCHPALPPDQQVALCLREICGLTTEAIAASFFVKPAAMAQRIVRAKGRIKSEGFAYEVPARSEIAGRLEVVLRVIHLVFSEGHATGADASLVRTDLCEEAIRLARLLRDQISDADIDGLLGLMLLTHARRAARMDTEDTITPLDEQDRSLWNFADIDEGRLLVRRALDHPPYSTYTLQGAIALEHAATLDGRAPDWTTIVGWYDLLRIADPGAVTELNRAIAVGMRDGPAAGLELVNQFLSSGTLNGYRYALLARADFLRRLERDVEAGSAYRAALDLTVASAERRFIERRLTGLGGSAGHADQGV